MVSTPRFLSRRALLKIAAASPLAAFALSPFAHAEMLAAGRAIFTDKTKRDRFYKTAEKLWKAFEDGVDRRAKKLGISVIIGEGVFADALRLSGGPLIKNIECFDDNGDEIGGKNETHRCVTYCAEIATEAVKNAPNQKEITSDVFNAAWGATKDKYGSMTCDSPPDPGKVKDLGFGC